MNELLLMVAQTVSVKSSQQLYTHALRTAGSYDFIVPVGVTTIGALVIGNGGAGGGGLSYCNAIPVVPGETLRAMFDGIGGHGTRLCRGSTILCGVTNGSLTGTGGRGGKAYASSNDGGGSGGNGYIPTGSPFTSYAAGGAGGYSGAGGNGTQVANGNGVAGTGGGGGGGAMSEVNGVGGSGNGGGVGIYGSGANGAAGSTSTRNATAGSGGNGKNYGGGSIAPSNTNAALTPGTAVIRLHWMGSDNKAARNYPAAVPDY